MFAGDDARDHVLKHLNSIGNAMNLQSDTRMAYDDLGWGIEAMEDNGKVRFLQLKHSFLSLFQTQYIYREVFPSENDESAWPVKKVDGEIISFGMGTEGTQLGGGPLPYLCNLKLAVARVMHMSGAADVILQWKDEANDDGMPHNFIASEEFCDILDARLLLSGQVLAA